MRVSQLVLLLSLATAFGPRATAAQVMTMGLKGGASMADARIQQDGIAVSTERRNSFDVAGIMGLAFSQLWALQIEVHVAGRGFRLPEEVSGLTPGANILYFDIPLLSVFNLAVGDNPILTPRLFAGPLVALRMICTPIGAEATPTIGECGADVAKQVDFGVALGGGVKIGGGPGGLLLDVSYNQGLANLSRSTDSAINLKNRSLVFAVGFVVPIV